MLLWDPIKLLRLKGNVDKTVENAFINIYQSNNPNTVLKNSIVYGNVKMTQGTIESGIICNIPDNTNVTVGSYQTLTAEGGIITPVMSGSIPADVKFMGKAYIVGNQNLTTTFTILSRLPRHLQNGITTKQQLKQLVVTSSRMKMRTV